MRLPLFASLSIHGLVASLLISTTVSTPREISGNREIAVEIVMAPAPAQPTSAEDQTPAAPAAEASPMPADDRVPPTGGEAAPDDVIPPPAPVTAEALHAVVEPPPPIQVAEPSDPPTIPMEDLAVPIKAERTQSDPAPSPPAAAVPIDHPVEPAAARKRSVKSSPARAVAPRETQRSIASRSTESPVASPPPVAASPSDAAPRAQEHPASPAPAVAPAPTAASGPTVAPALPIIVNPSFRNPPAPPVYPKRARDLDQQGEALVRARLDRDGNAEEIVLWRSSGYDLLDNAALSAARRWQFEPARHNGEPIVAWVQIPIRFSLR